VVSTRIRIDTYFELNSDLEENKLIDLHNRYNLFYKSEDSSDQESVGRIIQQIERDRFSIDVNGIFDAFNT